MKLEHSLIPYTKINSKWIKDLNVRPDTIKLLEENIGRTLFDINCSNIFLDLTCRVIEIKPKLNKWDLIKLKSFCTAKETINKTKRQPTKREKISANNATNKGLISKYTNSSNSSILKKQTTQSKKWAGASLVAQWLRICLLMQETRVRALVWEDPTCHGAAGPVSHSC